MKTLWQAISVIAVLHVLLALGLLVFLVGTDRLNRERVSAVKDTFETTIAAEQQAEQEAAKLEQEAKEQAERLARLTGADQTVVTTAERLEEDQRRTEYALQRLERTREEIEDLKRNLTLLQQSAREQQQEVAEKQQAFERMVKEWREQRNGEGFGQAVELYEQLPPKQTKSMFIELLEEGGMDEVVRYLEAMQPRKAAGVLREFKTDEELSWAVQLTERLRTRGSDLIAAMEDAG
jgi:chromosome segregation ATPase